MSCPDHMLCRQSAVSLGRRCWCSPSVLDKSRAERGRTAAPFRGAEGRNERSLPACRGAGGRELPPVPLSPGPVKSRRSESSLHHQSRPFDRILALQLINLLHRAASRPVTKLKEPHKWPSPGDKPLHRITY